MNKLEGLYEKLKVVQESKIKSEKDAIKLENSSESKQTF
jgi:hypothetical protein